MKTVGPFVAARSLDTGLSGAAQPVKVLHALDRLTGMPALVYLLPQAVTLPELPETPSLLPYVEVGIQGEQAYVACELPPHAGLASDPLQTALGGLRALNALHEAGLVHGGVGPHQLWEWDGDVRLAGAALPWGEAQGALAAPEGGISPAADLYALGVTLLRMGPLPAGLSDLLSSYPAQRPSARDALARFNAGPPLPTPVAPLMVQAPLHPREVGPVSLPEPPLPPIADLEQPPGSATFEFLPDELVPAGLPVFDWEEVNVGGLPKLGGAQVAEVPTGGVLAAEIKTAEIGTAEPEALPTAALPAAQPTAAPAEAAALVPAAPDTTESELLTFLATFPAADAPQTSPVDAEPVTAPAAESPAPEAEPAQALLTDPAPNPVPSPSRMAAEPEGEARITEVAQALVFSSAVPTPVITAGTADQVRPDQTEPDHLDLETAPADTGRSNSPMSPSSRQLKPVKIGWSQDGSWQVKKSAGAALPFVANAAPLRPDDAPPPYVRPRVAPPSPPGRLNPLWLLALVVAAVLVALLAQRAFRSDRAALGTQSCCTVTSRLVGSAGQGLSAPVKVSVLSMPPASRLKAGTLIGQAPGPLLLDTPGQYALKVVGDGYAAQTVNVTVPTAQPLVIMLK